MMWLMIVYCLVSSFYFCITRCVPKHNSTCRIIYTSSSSLRHHHYHHSHHHHRPYYRKKDGRTPLILASRWGYQDALHALLKKGANMEAKDNVIIVEMMMAVIDSKYYTHTLKESHHELITMVLVICLMMMKIFYSNFFDVLSIRIWCTTVT